MVIENPDERVEVLSEALPFIKEFHGEKIIVKFGGSVMSEPDVKRSVAGDIVFLQYIGLKPIVVHGGGPQIGRTLERMGLDSNFVDGLRVTDRETMDVVEMVLAGRVNKDIVNQINSAGANAIGLSGKDGRMLLSKPHPSGEKVDEDIGQVGVINRVRSKPMKLLQDEGYVPVIAPIGVDEDGTTYNMNADEVSGAIASSLNARKLIYLTDVEGILKDDRLQSTIAVSELEDLIDRGVIEGGMIPKVQSARKAVLSGVNKVHIIDGTHDHSLLLELLTEEGIGTQIVPERYQNESN